MRLAIVSDTHVPTRESEIPDQFRREIRNADHTVHAGDFETADVLEEVRDLSAELTAVHGNTDPRELGLPSVAERTLDGVAFVVTHGTLNHVEAAVYDYDGAVTSREDWLDAVADTARARTGAWDGEGVVGIGGHTHRVEDTTHEGVRLLNPGSLTGARPAEEATMMTVDIDGCAIDVTVHEA